MNEKDITTFFTYLQSQETSQQYLMQCYKKLDGVDAETKSYENCNKFIYYMEHANQFYQSGKKLNTILQPVLFFYGMVHLLKASLLTVRPDYPESSKILSHGVSSRKRKKKQYTFMQDEVKIQNNGLFPYFTQHLFSIDIPTINKYKMEHLFSFVPEMASLFSFSNQKKWYEVGEINSRILTFPIQVLDNYHLTAKSFLSRIKTYLPKINHTKINKNSIYVELSTALTTSTGPFFYNLTDRLVCFPTNKSRFLPISEVMVHYLLLYNLSMLCRYETEWWGDLLVTKPDIDYPFIIHFLQLTSVKIPLLIGQLLYEKRSFTN